MQLRAHSSPLLLLPPDSNLAPAPSQQHTRIITVTTINKRLYRFVGREEEIAGGTHFRRYFDLKRKRKSVDRSILLFWLVVVVASRARAEPQNREVRRAVTVLGCSENGQYFYFLSEHKTQYPDIGYRWRGYPAQIKNLRQISGGFSSSGYWVFYPALSPEGKILFPNISTQN